MVVLIAKFRELSRHFCSISRPFKIPKVCSTTTLALLSSLLKVFSSGQFVPSGNGFMEMVLADKRYLQLGMDLYHSCQYLLMEPAECFPVQPLDECYCFSKPLHHEHSQGIWQLCQRIFQCHLQPLEQ